MFGFTIIVLFAIVLGIASFIIWVWALIDCLTSKITTQEKLLWVVVILLLNLIGAIIYFLFRQKVSKTIKQNEKRMKKSNDRIIAGVCGGIADYYNMDPTVVRLLFVLFTLFTGGIGIFIYIIAAFIMPSDSPQKRTGMIIAIILAFFIFLIIAGFFLITLSNARYNQGVSVARSVRVESNAMQDIIAQRIIESTNYKQYGGHGLTFLTVTKGECGFRDPYGLKLDDCMEYHYRFYPESDDISSGGVNVKAKIAGNRIEGITFSEIEKPDPFIESCPAIVSDDNYIRLKSEADNLSMQMQYAVLETEEEDKLQKDLESIKTAMRQRLEEVCR